MTVITKIVDWFKDNGITDCPSCNQHTLEISTYFKDGKCTNCKYSETIEVLNKREIKDANAA